MLKILVKVSNKVARQENKQPYICGNNDFVVVFDFDAEWDDYPLKTARFISNGEYIDVVFNGNECNMPMFSNTHTVFVGVYAGDLRTTTPALIAAAKSILCGSQTEMPAEPTPDVYAQIMEIMNDAVIKTNASEQAAKESEGSAAESASAAEAAALEAEEHAAMASTFSTNANNARASAQLMQVLAKQEADRAEAAADRAEAAGGTGEGIPGPAGKDGFSPVVVVRRTENGAIIDVTDKNGTTSTKINDGNGIKSAALNADYTLTLTFDDGTSYITPSIRGATGANGSDGKDGEAGADGVGIASIKQTLISDANDGNNVITVTLTDGTSANFTVKNGSKGSPGESVSIVSISGSTVSGGSNVVTFSDGKTLTVKNGRKGEKGDTGPAGSNAAVTTENIISALGYTPADAQRVTELSLEIAALGTQEDIVQAVIAALGTPVFGRVDEDNNIILTGNLVGGKYTVKYENEDGSLTDVGTLTFDVVSYTNLADQTSADWLTDKRINSSGVLTDAAGVDMTNFIPVTDTSVLHIKGLDIMSALANGQNYGRLYYYDSNKTYLGYQQPDPNKQDNFYPAADYDAEVRLVNWEAIKEYYTSTREANVSYIRFGGIPTDDKIIITDGEKITGGGSYTNLFDPATTQINTRMKSDGINTEECPGLIATDYIDLGSAMEGGGENVLHAKGFRFCVGTYDTQFTYVHYYNESKTLLGKIENTTATESYDVDGNPCFTLDAQYTTARYVRVTGLVSASAITVDDVADAVLTLNELIGA